MAERALQRGKRPDNNRPLTQPSFDEILIRSAKLIGTHQVTPEEKLALLGSVCADLYPEKIHDLGQALNVKDEEWQDFVNTSRTNDRLKNIHKQVLAQLEISRLAQNLNIIATRKELRPKRGDEAKTKVLVILEKYKQENPGQHVNLTVVGRQIGHGRASISLIYKQLEADHHDLPPKRTQRRFRKEDPHQ